MKGEAAFIAALRTLVTHPGARGLADDCAVIEVGSETLVLTHDTMVEGVHTLPGQDAGDIAWKLLATNLSDLASCGARPIGVLLAHTLGDDDAAFVEGLGEALGHYGTVLLGGDTVGAGGARSWGLTAIGAATHCPVPSRAGARADDRLWLTGELGAAMLGFEALRGATGADSSAFRRPMARIAEGEALAPLVTAMMDVSDGLLLDAARMAAASGVTLAIDSAAVPSAAGAARRADALRWGEDYELLFTLPEGTKPPVPAALIGEVRPRGDAALLLDEEAPREPLGYQHG